jgi:ADP-heptose:LPS heptosyltransferase
MASRALSRARTLFRAALDSLRPRLRARPGQPRSILVLHELLLGDTLMLASLLAALRDRYRDATIHVAARPEFLPLFSGRPYGVQALPFTERDANALDGLAPARGCDIAIVPGENRYALTARALGARWIVALAGARPGWKNRIADELIDIPAEPAGLADLFARLAGPPRGLRYRLGDWPAPAYAPFPLPKKPYALLHVGARTPLRYWPAERWSALAEKLTAENLQVVLSAGPNETGVIGQIDPAARYASFGGTLDLAQLWHLVAGAELVVTLDTGVAHLAKLTGNRTLCLYGPGSATLFGRGEFWRDAPFTEITVADFPCRDQRILFGREIGWVRRCNRSLKECARPRCMEAITLEEVVSASARPGVLRHPAA